MGANGIALLRRRPGQQPPPTTSNAHHQRAEGRIPFFLQVNFPSPHPPFLVSSCVAKTLETRQFGAPLTIRREQGSDPEETVGRTTARAARQWRLNYGGLIEGIDEWVGVYVNVLKRTGILDETLICFTADHGDMLGDFARCE